MVNQQKLEKLLSLFADGKISREEYKELMDHVRAGTAEQDLENAIDRVFSKIKKFRHLSDEAKEEIYQNIILDSRFKLNLPGNARKHNPKVLRIWQRAGIAASILLLISTALYFYSQQNPVQKLSAEIRKSKTEIVRPGGNKAVLTLSDGSRIILDSARNGILANQAGVDIQKTSDGELLYSFSNSENLVSDKLPEKEVYNKIETPVGGKYQLYLPDGSKVWLNSASSLRFPALFTGNTREVELTGEAFFDVAKNKNKPFKVITKDQIVEVLGTQFNINSYADEGAIKTTLIEGSVKILYKDKVVMLSPGQQFQPIGETNTKVINADTDEVVAWKNGYFLFKNEDIQSIMRKISRWYDVEVVYNGEIPDISFGGNISKSKDVSEVLDVLQLTSAIHFKKEGRRITVMP